MAKRGPKSQRSTSEAAVERNSSFTLGAVILGIAWLVMAVLALTEILVEDDWALYIGIAFGVLAIPLAIWTFKQDPAAH